MDASRVRVATEVRKTVAAAVAAGEVHQLADGRVGVMLGANSATSGDQRTFTTEGQYVFTKTAGIVLLDGGRAYWDHSVNAVTFRTVNDRDFFLGTVVDDAASADVTCAVNINVEPVYEVEFAPSKTRSQGAWVTEATNGLGVSQLPGGVIQLAFDAVVEAAQAAIYPERSVNIASNPILEFRMAAFDIGDNAALDFNIGLASGSHATDFQTVAEQVTLHFNGTALDIFAESDDSVTDVNETDTTINAVDDTWFECWIDCRNTSDVQIYINGVLVLPNTVFTLAAAAGPLVPIVHMEKTSDDTTADFRVDFMRLRIAEQ